VHTVALPETAIAPKSLLPAPMYNVYGPSGCVVSSAQVTAVYGIILLSICRTRPYNAAYSFSLHCCPAHISSSMVLVKGKVNHKDWVSHKMKIIMFIVDHNVAHIFLGNNIRNWDGIFLVWFLTKKKLKSIRLSFLFSKKMDQKFLYKVIIYASWTQHFNVAMTSFSLGEKFKLT